MSGRQRLTDAEVEGLHDFIRAEAGASADVVAADHLRARRDVQRLAKTIRWLAPYQAGGHGAYCWCHPDRGSCLSRHDKTPTQDTCRYLNAFLAEVSP